MQINNKYNELLQTVAKSQGFRPQLKAMLVQEPSEPDGDELIPATSAPEFWKLVEQIVEEQYPDQRPGNDALQLKDIEDKPFPRKELFDYYSKFKSLAKLTAAKLIQETNARPKEVGVDFENLLKGIKECRNINLSLLKFLFRHLTSHNAYQSKFLSWSAFLSLLRIIHCVDIKDQFNEFLQAIDPKQTGRYTRDQLSLLLMLGNEET